MRSFILAAVAAATLTLGGAAFAQSQQGGYLGQTPAASQTASVPAPRPADVGSGQGGYLGLNPGSHQTPAKTAEEDMKGSPAAWCSNSTVPGRCMSRAASDHAYCMQKDADHYASCRRAMDYIGWHN